MTMPILHYSTLLYITLRSSTLHCITVYYITYYSHKLDEFNEFSRCVQVSSVKNETHHVRYLFMFITLDNVLFYIYIYYIYILYV